MRQGARRGLDGCPLPFRFGKEARVLHSGGNRIGKGAQPGTIFFGEGALGTVVKGEDSGNALLHLEWRAGKGTGRTAIDVVDLGMIVRMCRQIVGHDHLAVSGNLTDYPTLPVQGEGSANRVRHQVTRIFIYQIEAYRINRPIFIDLRYQHVIHTIQIKRGGDGMGQCVQSRQLAHAPL